MAAAMVHGNDRFSDEPTRLEEIQVNENATHEEEAGATSLLRAKLNRANLLTAAAAGVAIAAVPRMANAQTAAATESAQDIINIRVTNEFFGVTVLTAAIKNADQLGLNANGGLLLRVIQAALAEEQYHVDFLTAQGAKPLLTTFTVPDPRILTNPLVFFSTLEMLETLEIGMDMSATRQFSQMGQIMLAQAHYQIGGVEAEHRVLARAALAMLGQTAAVPPNNRAFELDVVYYLREAEAIMRQRGFFGGAGTPAPYPGREAALAAAGAVGAAVTDKTP